MKKFKLGAVIPTHQYSNIQPEIEVEAETFEEAIAIAEAQLIPFWNKYVEGGKELKTSRGELIKGIGGDIFYDDATHTYTNDKGEAYESSSQYASKFVKPFDKQKIAEATAKKYGVDVSEVLDMWNMRGQVSRDLGSALHLAIELHRKHQKLCRAMDNEKNLHDSPMIKQAILELEKLLPVGEEKLEAVVVDHEAKRVGRVDLIQITAPQTCNIVDFKTGEMKDHYWKQLEFTAGILKNAGYKVNKLRIFHWAGKWEVHEHETND